MKKRNCPNRGRQLKRKMVSRRERTKMARTKSRRKKDISDGDDGNSSDAEVPVMFVDDNDGFTIKKASRLL
jgi:hypothetical protein